MILEYKKYFYFKCFYLGNSYHGIQIQPDVKTVEGELLTAFIKAGYLASEETSNVQPDYNLSKYSNNHLNNPKRLFLAGRTDKGVHARTMVGAVLTHKEKFNPMEINQYLPDDINIWAYAEIPDFGLKYSRIFYKRLEHSDNIYHQRIKRKIEELTGKFLDFKSDNEIFQTKKDEIINIILHNIDKPEFNELIPDLVPHPRHNTLRRLYKYILMINKNEDSNGRINLERMQEAAEMLKGKHDFSNLCKNEPDRSPVRTLDSISLNILYDSENNKETASDNGNKTSFFNYMVIEIEFSARSFLWKQVRKMSRLLYNVGIGKWNLETVEKILNADNINWRNKIEPLPPHFLILWDIQYPEWVKFKINMGAIKHMDKILTNNISNMFVLSRISGSWSEC